VEGRRRQGYGGLVTTVATRTALITGHHLVWLAVEEGNAGAARLYARLDYRPAGLWRRLVKTA
jgi:predicted GNAT family acetyltransferase